MQVLHPHSLSSLFSSSTVHSKTSSNTKFCIHIPENNKRVIPLWPQHLSYSHKDAVVLKQKSTNVTSGKRTRYSEHNYCYIVTSCFVDDMRTK